MARLSGTPGVFKHCRQALTSFARAIRCAANGLDPEFSRSHEASGRTDGLSDSGASFLWRPLPPELLLNRLAHCHGVIVVVVVVVALVVVVVQAAQQVLLVPAVPPAVWQLSAEEAMLHVVPQSLSALQLTLVSLAQVWFAESQVLAGTWHVTAPGLPQVDRAAQRMIRPTHGWGTAAWVANCPSARATHLR